MKYEAVKTYSQHFSVRKMCKVLGLAGSAYYQWLRRKEKQNQKREEQRELALYMRIVFENNHKVYGYRRMYRALLNLQDSYTIQGKLLPSYLTEPISEYKVRHIMQQNGLFPLRTIAFKPYRRSKSKGQYFDNVLDRNFSTSRPNEVWA